MRAAWVQGNVQMGFFEIVGNTGFWIAASVALLAGFMRGFVGVGSGMLMAPVFAILFGPLQKVNRPALPAGGDGIAVLRGHLRDSALREERMLSHE